ncbi:MAG TPA: hypothetical protein VIJ22_19080 [Polyangiaceae bacterium]
MDQVHVVRHKVLVEGLSARRVAREMGVSRNTVKRYLSQAAPVRVEQVARGRPVWEKAGARLEALLGESPQWTGGKQRLTATRLHAMLIAEGLTIGVTTVREAVAEWKRRRREVFVPLVYPAGDLAEVDFFEVLVDLAGARIKTWMFVMRLMHSGRDFAWVPRPLWINRSCTVVRARASPSCSPCCSTRSKRPRSACTSNSSICSRRERHQRGVGRPWSRTSPPCSSTS